jgi:hypothetical protein
MAQSLEGNGLNRSGESQPLTDGTGKLSIATVNRVTADRGFEPGGRASAIVKLFGGTDSCQTPHTGWVARGGSSGQGGGPTAAVSSLRTPQWRRRSSSDAPPTIACWWTFPAGIGAFVEPRIPSAAVGRSERLTRLVYELLDAHADTERLSRTHQSGLWWHAHLRYLRDLQRAAREVLAHGS